METQAGSALVRAAGGDGRGMEGVAASRLGASNAAVTPLPGDGALRSTGRSTQNGSLTPSKSSGA